MVKLFHIKSETYKRGWKLKDVWFEIHKQFPSIDFPAFSRIINGYQKIPDGFEYAIIQVFEKNVLGRNQDCGK